MEHTVGYLAIWDCLDLIRIQGVSSLVNTLTMALRAFFARRNLSYINQVLAGISMKDNLTGLYNRLGYHDLAYPLYQEVTGRGGKLAIIFIDMDGLKHINDTFGHSVGDQAIRSVAAVILRYLPKGAIPVRYGGDEFLLLMPAENEGDVRKLLDSISSALPAEAKALGVPDVVSISSGFVLTDPEDRKPLDDYVLEADGLMYDEKKKKKGKG
jgi:diguanylate cyclase (GGDEF)-like protein